MEIINLLVTCMRIVFVCATMYRYDGVVINYAIDQSRITIDKVKQMS